MITTYKNMYKLDEAPGAVQGSKSWWVEDEGNYRK